MNAEMADACPGPEGDGIRTRLHSERLERDNVGLLRARVRLDADADDVASHETVDDHRKLRRRDAIAWD